MIIKSTYGDTSEIVVKGTIDSVSNSDEIISEINKANENNKGKIIHLKIKDSYIVLSRLIGDLLKLIESDKIDIRVFAGEENLYSLLSKLGFKDVFKLEKM